MKTTLKLLSVSSALLLGFFTAQSQSYANWGIVPKSDLLISNSTGQKKIKTVIASGYGTSIESAAQNAAQNALTNVAGTFISAKTMLEERSTIVDGILSESVVIKENINSYSQGSIKYFEVLDKSQNDSIYQVTARVDVRIDNFRAYIKKLALKTKEISTTNLVIEMKTKKNNLDNKFKFLPDIITPIFKGEVNDFEIGEIRSINDLLNDKNCINYVPYRFCKPISSAFFLDTDKTVYFTFAVKLKKDFYTNVINTLENISDLKTSSVTPYNGEDAFNRIAKNNFWSGQDVGIIIRENKKQVHSQYFILKGIGSRTANWNSSGYGTHNSKYVNNYFTKKLIIDLLDSNGEILYSFQESCKKGGDRYPKYYGFKGGLRTFTRIHVAYMSYFDANGMKNYIGKTNYCPSQLYSTLFKNNNIIFDITNRKKYMFAFELNDINQLSEIQGIRIRYIN